MKLVKGLECEKAYNNEYAQTTFYEKGRMSLLVLVTLLMTVVGTIMIGCGQNELEGIEQTVSEVELGQTIRLLDCVSIDSNLIKDVVVSDDGTFDYNKVGEYTIIYTITTNRNETEDVQYTIIVEDTTAPSLEIDAKEIYLSTGEQFIIDKYVDVNDNSGTLELEYNGNVDTNTEGRYSIDVCAKDASGNVSDYHAIDIIVQKRECDVRNAKFGDSHECVEQYETEEGGIYSEGRVNSTLTYETSAAGVNVTLIYTFNKQDQLFAVVYLVSDQHTNYNEYYNDYNEVDQNLIDKYGTPDVQKEYKGSLYGYCNDVGEAIMLGEVAYNTEWDLENMNIYHYMQNDNGVQHIFSYVSKEFQQTNDNSGY